MELLVISSVLVFLIATTIFTGDIVTELDEVSQADKVEMIEDVKEIQGKYTDDELMLTLITVPFLIYAAVNFSRFVVKDYETGWIQEIFTYPTSRKKMLGSKILLGYVVSFIGMLLSSLFVYGMLSLVKMTGINLFTVIQILVSSMLTPLIALIAMGVGISRKSSVITIITGTILTELLQGNLGTFSLQDFPFINYALALIGVVLTGIILSRINRYDFVK